MRTNTSLQIHYYCLYVLLLALLACVHFSNSGMPLYVLSDSGTLLLSTFNILVLLCIPLMFKLFAKKVDANASQQTYAKWALIQMYLIALPAVTSVITYALTRETTPLFCYLIAFVSLVFCKPTRQKWEYYKKHE